MACLRGRGLLGLRMWVVAVAMERFQSLDASFFETDSRIRDLEFVAVGAVWGRDRVGRSIGLA